MIGQINQFGKASVWIIPIMNKSILKPSIAKTVYNSLNSRVEDILPSSKSFL